jgi:EmrB/QacA subfamily drug resistance transporter
MEHLEKKQKVLIMIAIMSTMLFAALNQTIVGTALPRIIADLGGLEYFSWVFTIYMLASSITAILVGKLSDIYGRKPFILIGIGIFMLGSFLSGTSNSIIELIIYRGVQGFGGGMIMSTAFTAIGDLFSPRERGRWQGMMGSVFGLASVFGPTLGGWIVDHTDWHWVFWVFLPFGFIAFILIMRLFPSVEKSETDPIDYSGSIVLTLTIVPLLLALTWGGSEYSWSSFQIIGLLVFTVIALLSFIWIEKRAKSPVLPLHLFRNKIFTLSNLVGFTLGAGMFGAIMYMPFFIQGVIGQSATVSGLMMMPMTLSMVLTSAVCGQLITKTGKYKIFALVGLFVMSMGMFSLSMMGSSTSNLIAISNIIFVGLGLGMAFPVFTLTVQNAVSHKLLGTATATTQLFRQLGGTVGVAVMGTIMSNRMQTKMEGLATESGISLNDPSEINPQLANTLEELKSPQVLVDPNKLEQIQASLPEDTQQLFTTIIDMLKESLSYSLTGVFFVGALVVFAAFVLTIFLEEIPLRKTNKGSHLKEEMPDNVKPLPSLNK